MIGTIIVYQALVFICPATLPHRECVKGMENVTVNYAEELERTPMLCLLRGEEKMATLAYAPTVEDNRVYYKVRCEPVEISAVGGR